MSTSQNPLIKDHPADTIRNTRAFIELQCIHAAADDEAHPGQLLCWQLVLEAVKSLNAGE